MNSCASEDPQPWLTAMTPQTVLQAPLFGMLSWVNSSEVRRWLQTKIADPQTLRCTSAPQDSVFGNAISRHDSDNHLAGAQDGMPGMPLPSHHPDMAWVSVANLRPALTLWGLPMRLLCISKGWALGG